ncbi:MAG: hypothetical protein ACP5OE_09810, partial [Thermodesulfobium sp.]
MKGKPNEVKNNALRAIPFTLEGAQLALQNAERLFIDSQNVSIPTQVALLEIGLEEVAKAWGILFNFEKNLFDQNPEYIKTYFKSAHIDPEKYNKKLAELDGDIKEFLEENDPSSFSTPFDTETFSNHKAK